VITANDGTDAMTKISKPKARCNYFDVVLPGKVDLNCVAIKAEAGTSAPSRDVLNQRK